MATRRSDRLLTPPPSACRTASTVIIQPGGSRRDVASRLDDAIGGLDAALLVMHSPVDELVGIDHARRIYEQARHPKSFVSLDGADHLLSRRPDGAYVARLLAVWAGRYLPEPEPDPGTATSDLATGAVLVEESGSGPFASGSLRAATPSSPTNPSASATTPVRTPMTCCSRDSARAPR